jgi:UDP-3-O-[3-hydroxymyristoyl] N-acetylglucosamine deacetylase
MPGTRSTITITAATAATITRASDVGDLSVGKPTNVGLNGSGSTTSPRQKTLKSSIHCSGIGLHSGEKISMSLHPADIDTGIVFRRADLRGQQAEIAAHFGNVSDTRLCTSLSNDAGTTIATVEHLMAALAGCEIDNAVIEVAGPEVPIMDGSSEPFVFLIECAGVEEQAASRLTIQILKPKVAHIGEAVTKLEPADVFSIELSIEYDNPVIGQQTKTVAMCADTFKSEICRARTFGFLEDVEAMRKAGLAHGGSLDNAVVVSGDKVLNDGGLRYDDEFVRHKILDSLGDLYLAGGPIIGRFSGHRAGHQINNKLLRALFADTSAWTYVTGDDVALPESSRWAEAPAVAVA